jgi:signal transduction histidine kinase
MKPENISKLFGITRVRSVVGTRGERGNGMGLVICNDLVRSIGGRLKAEGILGDSSSFGMTLPENADAVG